MAHPIQCARPHSIYLSQETRCVTAACEPQRDPAPVQFEIDRRDVSEPARVGLPRDTSSSVMLSSRSRPTDRKPSAVFAHNPQTRFDSHQSLLLLTLDLTMHAYARQRDMNRH